MTLSLIRTGSLLGLAALVLAACAPAEPELMNIRSDTEGPDEFAILPVKPLETPPNYTDLPPPNPGGSNITDPNPRVDAIAALGGNPARLSDAGIPAVDAGLIAHASRFGRSGNIREQLAAEDLDYRRQNSGLLLERWANVNVYYDAYEPMTLDSHAELERWRQRGARTPSAPPPPVDD